jgi:hypothetical protein
VQDDENGEHSDIVEEGRSGQYEYSNCWVDRV